MLEEALPPTGLQLRPDKAAAMARPVAPVLEADHCAIAMLSVGLRLADLRVYAAAASAATLATILDMLSCRCTARWWSDMMKIISDMFCSLRCPWPLKRLLAPF